MKDRVPCRGGDSRTVHRRIGHYCVRPSMEAWGYFETFTLRRGLFSSVAAELPQQAATMRSRDGSLSVVELAYGIGLDGLSARIVRIAESTPTTTKPTSRIVPTGM